MLDDLAIWQLVVAHPLLAVAIVFLLDGLGLPLMPEVAALAAFAAHPDLAWGAVILAIIVALEVGAAAFLYAITGLLGIHPRLQRLMKGYASHMLLRDERLLLLNRVVPVLPMAGAFIRASGWRPGRSFLMVGIGSAAKYGLLLSLSGIAYDYFTSQWAFASSMGLAGAFLAASWAYTGAQWWRKRRADQVRSASA